MKPIPSSEYNDNEQDQEIIELLKDLGSFKSKYPPGLFAARRAAFLTRVDELSQVDTAEELSPGDQEFVQLLTDLRSVQVEYPADLRTATRAALLRHMERADVVSPWDRFRNSIERIFHYKTAFPIAGRLSLVIASLVAVVLLGSLFLDQPERSFQPSASQAAPEPTYPLTASPGEAGITICRPGVETPSCPPGGVPPGQDLANIGNGLARPAVSKDARSGQHGVHQAAFVNDGESGASWVSNSSDSWIKIDLGRVATINTVSFQKGDSDPGQFLIAVAVSDEYADGDSRHDYDEYVQVFESKGTGFSGTVSYTETIRMQFPAVKARFVKITFEKAGAAIEEVGVFMVKAPVQSEQATGTVQDDPAASTSTPVGVNTLLATSSATQVVTGMPTGTTASIPTNTLSVERTLTPLPTETLAPADTPTPVPTELLPGETPILPPTLVPPTAVLATEPLPPPSTDPIIVTSSDQTWTFTCNGNAAEIRGHSNTVTLLGSCSSITVSGNGNRVYWESGSPVITIKGKDNIVQQL